MYWDLQRPEELDPNFSGGKGSTNAQSNTYNREHIYEIQFSTSLSPESMLSLRMTFSITVHRLPFPTAINLEKERAIILQLGRHNNEWTSMPAHTMYNPEST